MADFKIPLFREPTPAERKESGDLWYERVSHTFIDRWPESVAALSFPTTFIPVDAAEMGDAFWGHPIDWKYAEALAARLDAAMGWTPWFVRLNSRSPKDAAYPVAPVTCSGKQAVAWIINSERCLDDTVCFGNAQQPMFICLRKVEWLSEDLEFRCFAKGGKLVGVTRYFYDKAAERTLDADDLWNAAGRFYDAHLAAHYPDIVFDLHDPLSDAPRLIEINPYGLSDPCCFDGYVDIESVGGVRLSKAPETP